MRVVRSRSPRRAPYQGLTRVTAKVERAAERRRIPAGSLWMPADQPDFEVAVQLLEPEAVDSLLSWGLLSTSSRGRSTSIRGCSRGSRPRCSRTRRPPPSGRPPSRTRSSPADANARYAWWFRRTPYWDETVGLLPYFRVMKAPALDDPALAS